MACDDGWVVSAMIKVHFCRQWDSPKDTLKAFAHMTPQSSCKWKNMEATLDPNEADWIVVIDKVKQSFPPDKTIYIGSHPPHISKHYCDYSSIDCAASLDVNNTLGFNEWWVQYSYDELVNMSPPKKTKDLIAIHSNKTSCGYHKMRREWLERFCDQRPANFELYGWIEPWGSLVKYYKGQLGANTPETYWVGKEDIYCSARYALELDAGPCYHYFSERFFDAMLLWCMPIYWGGYNVHDYLPEASFRYLKIEEDGADVIDIAATDFREQNLDAMAEARNLLLNKYQIWPMTYDLIKTL